MTEQAVQRTDPPEAFCTGKHRFDSPTLARQVAQRGRKRKDDSRGVYRCPHCDGWHIGNALRRRIVSERLGKAA